MVCEGACKNWQVSGLAGKGSMMRNLMYADYTLSFSRILLMEEERIECYVSRILPVEGK
jgi:hypothetical protein